MPTAIQLSLNDGTATITVDGPDTRNALDAQLPGANSRARPHRAAPFRATRVPQSRKSALTLVAAQIHSPFSHRHAYFLPSS
jgi:hypothetical protein